MMIPDLTGNRPGRVRRKIAAGSSVTPRLLKKSSMAILLKAYSAPVFRHPRFLLPGQTESRPYKKIDHVVFNRNEWFFSEERLRES